MKKMLMLATTVAMIEQFNKNNILILEEMGYEVHVIGNWLEGNPISDEKLEEFKVWIDEHHGKYFHMPSTRKPTDFNNIKAYRQVIKLIEYEHYDFIHCHTPIGSVIGRCAAHKTGTPIIYTAHGFHFYDGAPLKNWILYYPVEKVLSKWTDILITISREDFQRAHRRFNAKDLQYLSGIGINKNKIDLVTPADYIRTELKIPEDSIIIVSVGELNENKNHEMLIRALSCIDNKNLHYVIIGKGELKAQLRDLAEHLGIRNQVHLLGFRSDVIEILKASDYFALPSLREGLSVALMEAITVNIPVICGKIRGNVDLVQNGRNGFFFDPRDSQSIVNAINNLLCLTDEERQNIKLVNDEIVQNIDIQEINVKMKDIYMSIIQK